MKKIVALLLTLVILTGCTGKRDEMDRAMALRADLLACESCSFDVRITADYGDELHKFAMSCQGDNDGGISFTVTEPETIAGITGTIGAGEGKLTFDDVALQFPLLADGQVTPVSAPWILMKTLLGGYLTACAQEDDLLHVTIDDSYEEDALTLDIWIDGNGQPLQADIYENNQRILTLMIRKYKLL